MRSGRALAGAVVLLGVWTAAGYGAQRYATATASITPVAMGSSCLPQASAAVDVGAAWLLVDAMGEARAAFDRAADLDPDCALAYWGRALSRLQGPEAESPRAVAATLTDISRAASVPARTPFEQAAVAALQRLAAREAAPGVEAAWPVRVAAYRDAICETAPDTIWCARALAGTAPSIPIAGPEVSPAFARIAALHPDGPLDVGAALIVLKTAADPRAPLVDRALAAVATANPAAPWPHVYAAIVTTKRGEWTAAVEAGERASAVATDVFSRGAAMERRLEALLQLGRRREAYALAGAAVRVPDDAPVWERTFAVRAYARVIIGDRRLDGRGLADLAALPISDRQRQSWEVVFATALDAALRAWPGGDAGHLAKARAALDTLESLAGEDSVNEVDWAATIVEAAIAASQDEHQQMALFLTHAADLERREDLVRAGAPLVPTAELAAELWLRTYRYDDARREARAVLAASPHRISPTVVLARTSARVDDAVAAADAWRTVLTLRAKADANDSLRTEAERALAR